VGALQLSNYSEYYHSLFEVIVFLIVHSFCPRNGLISLTPVSGECSFSEGNLSLVTVVMYRRMAGRQTFLGSSILERSGNEDS
jgi:hypothetical protein